MILASFMYLLAELLLTKYYLLVLMFKILAFVKFLKLFAKSLMVRFLKMTSEFLIKMYLNFFIIYFTFYCGTVDPSGSKNLHIFTKLLEFWQVWSQLINELLLIWKKLIHMILTHWHSDTSNSCFISSTWFLRKFWDIFYCNIFFWG